MDRGWEATSRGPPLQGRAPPDWAGEPGSLDGAERGRNSPLRFLLLILKLRGAKGLEETILPPATQEPVTALWVQPTEARTGAGGGGHGRRPLVLDPEPAATVLTTGCLVKGGSGAQNQHRHREEGPGSRACLQRSLTKAREEPHRRGGSLTPGIPAAERTVTSLKTNRAMQRDRGFKETTERDPQNRAEGLTGC